jgi:hypothetical protein
VVICGYFVKLGIFQRFWTFGSLGARVGVLTVYGVSCKTAGSLEN